MPFTDQTEFPRGIFHTAALTNVAQDIGTASKEQKVSHYLISGGAAAEIIIWRRSGAGTEYFRTPVAIGETIIVPRGFDAPDGLEVLTASVAGDVYLTVFYYQ